MSEFQGVQLPRLAGGSQEADAAAAGDNQGADEGGSGFYQEHLANVPEDYRPHVEPYLRSIESNANERFREHADYRKQWEPYESIQFGENTYNLNDYDPEGLAQLIQFSELMENPDQFKEWWTAVGQQAGFYNNDNDVDDDFDLADDDGGLEDVSLEDFKSALNELLDERFAPFIQEQQQRQQSEEIEQANSAIDQQMEQLREEHGEFDEQAVYRFAYAHAESSENPILAGFQDYMRFVAQIENGTVNDKLGQPPPSEGAGVANTNQKAPDNFSDAKKMAMERIASLRQ